MDLKFVAAIFYIAAFATLALAQPDQPSPPQPSPPRSAPTMPSMPGPPPGIGPQNLPNDIPGAGAPPMPQMPGMPGARPMPSPINPNIGQPPPRAVPEPPARSTSSLSVIAFLDSTTPFVQAFDFILMIIAGTFCLRARKAPGLTILAISCFVSAIILLGFFLFGISHGPGAFPQAAYIVARLLAPFELLLFVIGIIIIARRNIAVR